MASPLNLLINEYPHLGKLVNGQEVVLKIKARVGPKTLDNQIESIMLAPYSIDFDEITKASVQDIMSQTLKSIDASLGMSNQPVG
jgi:hypothetical protein